MILLELGPRLELRGSFEPTTQGTHIESAPGPFHAPPSHKWLVHHGSSLQLFFPVASHGRPCRSDNPRGPGPAGHETRLGVSCHCGGGHFQCQRGGRVRVGDSEPDARRANLNFKSLKVCCGGPRAGLGIGQL